MLNPAVHGSSLQAWSRRRYFRSIQRFQVAMEKGEQLELLAAIRLTAQGWHHAATYRAICQCVDPSYAAILAPRAEPKRGALGTHVYVMHMVRYSGPEPRTSYITSYITNTAQAYLKLATRYTNKTALDSTSNSKRQHVVQAYRIKYLNRSCSTTQHHSSCTVLHYIVSSRRKIECTHATVRRRP